MVAWARFPWLSAVQEHTFTPLWLGYIVTVNAATFARTRRCMMLHCPRYFLLLFPLSAAFWWLFEYLNRFVQNWYYVGAVELSSLEYFVRATLPFSTVLSAVLSTAELLTSYPAVSEGMDWFQTDTPLRYEAGQLVASHIVMSRIARHWALAQLSVSTCLGWTAVAGGLASGIGRETDCPVITRAGRLARYVDIGAGGPDLRILLGALELEEPCSLGIRHSIRASVSAVRDAVARLCGVFTVRSRMCGGCRSLFEPSGSGEVG